jgi:hypothetical protein
MSGRSFIVAVVLGLKRREIRREDGIERERRWDEKERRQQEKREESRSLLITDNDSGVVAAYCGCRRRRSVCFLPPIARCGQ